MGEIGKEIVLSTKAMKITDVSSRERVGVRIECMLLIGENPIPKNQPISLIFFLMKTGM